MIYSSVSEIEEKRQLLKLLLQNPTLDGKKVRYNLLKPFDTILNYADSQLWLAKLDDFRNYILTSKDINNLQEKFLFAFLNKQN